MSVIKESRAVARLLDKKNHLFLDQVSWGEYQAILDELEGEGRRLRHTYDRGRLEIMTKSGAHEVPKSLLGSFIVILAEEMKRRIFMGGELTQQKEAKKRGIEPDQCYWVANEPRVRGKLEFDFNRDPPPDVLIEVEVSRTIIKRLPVLAALGVPEVWRFNRKTLQVGILQPEGQYQWGNESPSFPGIPINNLSRFLLMARTTDHTTIGRRFRKWVRQQLGKK